jgi:hypothetical protein
MARTVLDVDRDLLNEAKDILRQPTLTATINEALRLVVARAARERLMDDLANMDDDSRAAMAGARDQW